MQVGARIGVARRALGGIKLEDIISRRETADGLRERTLNLQESDLIAFRRVRVAFCKPAVVAAYTRSIIKIPTCVCGIVNKRQL